MSLLRSLFGKGDTAVLEQGPLYAQVKSVMADVQAYARSHGGEIELVNVCPEGDVTIRFKGACRGCPLSGMTLKHGVEDQLRTLVPGVRKIHSI